MSTQSARIQRVASGFNSCGCTVLHCRRHFVIRVTSAFDETFDGTSFRMIDRVFGATLVDSYRCYTEKASPTRHRPERQHNARSNRRKQCSPNETKPYSKPTLPRKRQTKPGVGVVLFTHCNSDRLSPEQVLIRAQIATTQCDTLSYGRSRLLLCAHVHDGSFHDVIVHVLQLAHFLSSYTPLNRHHRSIMPLRPQTCTHSRVRAFGHVQC